MNPMYSNGSRESTRYEQYGRNRKLFTGAGVFTDTVKRDSFIPPNDSNTIENVIFNNPATIVIWKDGTKTVVKCQPGDEFDKEKGLLMAIAKKHFNNQSNFNNVLKKFLPEEEHQTVFDGDKPIGEVIHIERTDDGIRALVKLVTTEEMVNPFAAIDPEAIRGKMSEIFRKRGFNV